MKNLYIDIGNTSVKFAVDKNESIEFIASFLIKDLNTTNISALLPNDIEEVFISSVVPNLTEDIKNIFVGKKVHIVETSIPIDVSLKIDDPKELGVDLFADLAGASEIIKGPMLIIDLGTASKFLYVDENNNFTSCLIINGLQSSLRGLGASAALLPELTFENTKPLLECRNTKDVLMSGAYYSLVESINGIVARYEKEIGHPVTKILTGFNSILVAKDLNFSYTLETYLCLKGLKVISKKIRG